mmetsp:Transcript_30573/g.101710  ORF Transcript_30573/g.101710 Transcript_30573/m.101710 type:complete len:147 (-) Transcript_30573:4-444(-)
MLPGADMATDLDLEQTWLAWTRTALSTIRTVFTFALMKAYRRTWLFVDICVTVALTTAAVATLIVGWQRFVTVRLAGVASRKRLSISPLMIVFATVAGISFAGAITIMLRKLMSPDPDHHVGEGLFLEKVMSLDWWLPAPGAAAGR